MNIIKPTIGRKLWFWPNGSHIGVPAQAQPQSQDPGQAMDATIVLVHGDRMVNLLVVDHAGISWPVCSVFLQQEGDATPGGMYAQWMPYQTGQAKKEAPAIVSADPFSHASAVLYPAIKEAMDELQRLHPGFNESVNRAFNILHGAFWSECPAPASAPTLRPDLATVNAPDVGMSVAMAVATKRMEFANTDDANERARQVADADVAKGLTPADIEAAITHEIYFTGADGRRGSSGCAEAGDPLLQLTFCTLVLRNGAKVVGFNYGSIDPARHSWEIGKREARAIALEKVWELEGYLLREKLSLQRKAAQ